eukprot:PhM_4_TR7006/c0_g1_i1/m.35082
MRRAPFLFATAIPRDAWDPAHHNPKWHDSHADHITKRRDWPSRKWLVGLVPKTPREFLETSDRNVVYQYNARMRACVTFPEIIPYYKEMLQRGVKIDVDTMYVVLSRAVRFEGLTAQDVFALCDEMVAHGARLDLATAEVLHTLWDTAVVTEDDVELVAWKEARRQFLGNTYNQLLKTELHRTGSRGLESLMQQTFAKHRANLRALSLMPSFENYAIYVSYLTRATPKDSAAKFDRGSAHALGSILGALEAVKDDIYVANRCAERGIEYQVVPRRNDTDTDTLLRLSPIVAQDAELFKSVSAGMSNIYLTALQNVVMRNGTAAEAKRLLYFASNFVHNLRKDGVRVSMEVHRELMNIAKFHGGSRTAFARNLVRNALQPLEFSKTGKPATKPADLRLLSRFVCAVDAWSAEYNPFVAPQKKGGEGEPGAASSSVPVRRTATDAMARYHEIRNVLQNATNVADLPVVEQKHAHEMYTALVFFTRSLLGEGVRASTKDDATTTTTTIPTDVAVACIDIIDDILTNVFGMMEAYRQPLDGEFVDHVMHLIERVSVRLPDQENMKSLAKLKHTLMERMKQDPAMVMAWVEMV